MKKVYQTASEVIHLWANQNKEEARTGITISLEGRKVCRVSFEGPTLYSYTTPIAKIISDNLVVISSYNYSMTTSKHQSLAYSSFIRFNNLLKKKDIAGDKIIVKIPEVEEFDTATIRNLMRDIRKSYNDYMFSYFETEESYRKRYPFIEKNKELFKAYSILVRESPELDLSIDEREEKINDFSHYFLEEEEAVRRELDRYKEALLKKHKEEKEKVRIVSLEKEQFINEKLEELSKEERIKEWRKTGIDSYISIDFRSKKYPKLVIHDVKLVEDTLLRSTKNKKKIYTSRGASVRYEYARALFNRWFSNKSVEGFRIDGYIVNSQEEEGLTIGCHFIKNEEIMKLAKNENWL